MTLKSDGSTGQIESLTNPTIAQMHRIDACH